MPKYLYISGHMPDLLNIYEYITLSVLDSLILFITQSRLRNHSEASRSESKPKMSFGELANR